jgi:predicted nucleotidyltransferase
MKPKVREGLLKIAEEFIDYLGDDIFVDDVVLTGSLSNFNWSEYSDFDLHILIDLQQFEKDGPLYKELFDLKKFIFNERHDIKIYGYDVELYAQDTEEVHTSSGVYSVMNNEWIDVPKKLKFEIDKKVLENKIKCWTDKIDKATETASMDDDVDVLENLRKKIKEYRKSGLEKEGELSYENLVFKFLRRSGYIQKLFDSTQKAVDKQLSIERKLEESI